MASLLAPAQDLSRLVRLTTTSDDLGSTSGGLGSPGSLSIVARRSLVTVQMTSFESWRLAKATAKSTAFSAECEPSVATSIVSNILRLPCRPDPQYPLGRGQGMV